MHGSPHIVSDVMTRDVATVERRTAFKDVVRLMQDRKVSAVPVVDRGDKVLGIVSEADLLPKEEFRDSDPDRYTQLRRLSDLAKAGSLTAEELMTSPPSPPGPTPRSRRPRGRWRGLASSGCPSSTPTDVWRASSAGRTY